MGKGRAPDGGKKRVRYDMNRSALKEGKTLSEESLLAQTAV